MEEEITEMLLPRNLHTYLVCKLPALLGDRKGISVVIDGEVFSSNGEKKEGQDFSEKFKPLPKETIDSLENLCWNNGTVLIPNYVGPDTLLQLSLNGGQIGEGGVVGLPYLDARLIGLAVRESVLNVLDARARDKDEQKAFKNRPTDDSKERPPLLLRDYEPHVMRVLLNRYDTPRGVGYEVVVEAFGCQEINWERLEDKLRTAKKLQSAEGTKRFDALLLEEVRKSEYRGLGIVMDVRLRAALGRPLSNVKDIVEEIRGEVDPLIRLVAYQDENGGRDDRDIGVYVSMPYNVERQVFSDGSGIVEGTRSTLTFTEDQLRNLDQLLENQKHRPRAKRLAEVYNGAVSPTLRRIYAEQMIINMAKGEVALPEDELEFWNDFLGGLEFTKKIQRVMGSGRTPSILLVGNDTRQLSDIMYEKYGGDNVNIGVANATVPQTDAPRHYVGPVDFMGSQKKYDVILCPSLQRASPFPKSALKRLVVLMADGGMFCAGVGWSQAAFDDMVEEYCSGTYTNLELQYQAKLAERLDLADVDRMLLPGILVSRGLDVERFSPLLAILHVHAREFQKYGDEFQELVYNSELPPYDSEELVSSTDIWLPEHIAGSTHLSITPGTQTNDYLVAFKRES